MTNEQNENSKNSGNNAERKAGSVEADQPTRNELESTELSTAFQDGLMSAEVEKSRDPTPNDLRKESLLGAIEAYTKREHKARTVKVKVRKLKL